MCNSMIEVRDVYAVKTKNYPYNFEYVFRHTHKKLYMYELLLEFSLFVKKKKKKKKCIR